jgi:uroporphyrinogen-III synthase
MAVLHALARHPGRVFSTAEIRALVPGWSTVDDHAIEVAVSRLRKSLDGADLDGACLVQTVMKRGYRLAI